MAVTVAVGGTNEEPGMVGGSRVPGTDVIDGKYGCREVSRGCWDWKLKRRESIRLRKRHTRKRKSLHAPQQRRTPVSSPSYAVPIRPRKQETGAEASPSLELDLLSCQWAGRWRKSIFASRPTYDNAPTFASRPPSLTDEQVQGNFA